MWVQVELERLQQAARQRQAATNAERVAAAAAAAAASAPPQMTEQLQRTLKVSWSLKVPRHPSAQLLCVSLQEMRWLGCRSWCWSKGI